ncbi:hypothetical protein [Micromonospora sp. NPDC051006]|uniref:hypothetical protein n=1 Tax=Micromonospora sp. NPDC051006 TaxID=3364283 RepID=UPI0037B68988
MTDPTEPEPIDWWLIVRIPDEMHLYQLGMVTVDELPPLIKARSDEHGVPENWWDDPGSGFEVALAQGEPHPKLIAQATTVTRLEGAS